MSRRIITLLFQTVNDFFSFCALSLICLIPIKREKCTVAAKLICYSSSKFGHKHTKTHNAPAFCQLGMQHTVTSQPKPPYPDFIRHILSQHRDLHFSYVYANWLLVPFSTCGCNNHSGIFPGSWQLSRSLSHRLEQTLLWKSLLLISDNEDWFHTFFMLCIAPCLCFADLHVLSVDAIQASSYLKPLNASKFVPSTLVFAFSVRPVLLHSRSTECNCSWACSVACESSEMLSAKSRSVAKIAQTLLLFLEMMVNPRSSSRSIMACHGVVKCNNE